MLLLVAYVPQKQLILSVSRDKRSFVIFVFFLLIVVTVSQEIKMVRECRSRLERNRDIGRPITLQ